MKKTAILFLVLILMVGLSTSVFAEEIGLGYGFFETKEGGGEVNGLFLTSEIDYGSGYSDYFRWFIGDGDGIDYNMIDWTFYKKINSTKNNTDFYLGAGWKWLTEDIEYQGYKIYSSEWGLPLSAKMKINLADGFTFGAEADYWFLGSYEVDSNLVPDFEGDFTGFGFDIYAEKMLTENTSIKVGYANEDYTFGADDSVGINDFDGGFSGFYFAGQVNY